MTLVEMEDILGLSAIPCLSRVRRRRPVWGQTQSTSSIPHQYFASTPTLVVWDTAPKAPLKVHAEAVPGPSVFPSGDPGVSGDFWVGRSYARCCIENG